MFEKTDQTVRNYTHEKMSDQALIICPKTDESDQFSDVNTSPEGIHYEVQK